MARRSRRQSRWASFLDEAEGEDGFGAEFIDGGVVGELEFGGVFNVEDGVFFGGEAVFEGVAGAGAFAFNCGARPFRV